MTGRTITLKPKPGEPLPRRRMERRRSARLPQARQVLIYPCHDEALGPAMRASLRDLSSTGVGLTCLGRLPVGARFVLRLDLQMGPPLLRVYQVVRCREAGDGACRVGARFVQAFTGPIPIPASR